MICTRSPVGKMVETIGFSRVMSCARERGCGRRQRHQILEIEAGFAFPCPATTAFNADLAGTVDNEFGDALVIEIFAQGRCHAVKRTAVFLPGAAII